MLSIFNSKIITKLLEMSFGSGKKTDHESQGQKGTGSAITACDKEE
jgi:hypothetical protein